MRGSSFLFVIVACTISGCNSGVIGTRLDGEWGNDQADLRATSDSAAVRINCSGIRIAGPITVDETGYFSGSGVDHYINDVNIDRAMHFAGQVRDGTIALSYYFGDTLPSPPPQAILLRRNQPFSPTCAALH